MVTMLVYASVVLISAAVLMALLRMFLGPTTPDRIVAADALSVITTVVLVMVAAWYDQIMYLDVTLVYGALAFVGVVAFARLMEL